MPVALPPDDGLQRVRLEDGRSAWLKRRHDCPASFFAAEVRGLETLAAYGRLRVPQVYQHGPHHLLIEDLGSGSRAPDFAARAGRGLAQQHRRRHDRFGFDTDGWCGDSPQDNTPDADGHRFFSERRLAPQTRKARDAGLLETDDTRRIDSVCANLHRHIPEQPPVLLHGDLWSGNLHCCGNGEPALIDAGAVHYGWAEAELAMLTLFGDPGAAFYHAYAETVPLATDWRERAPLYNLYHLLNHLNLFGAGYLNAVRGVLRRFA